MKVAIKILLRYCAVEPLQRGCKRCSKVARDAARLQEMQQDCKRCSKVARDAARPPDSHHNLFLVQHWLSEVFGGALITTPEFLEPPSYYPIPCGLFSPCSVDIGRSFGGVVPKFEFVQHK
ncbi:hypothetical protein FHG87_018886 [Trinorchestia longiramus]|nr:hypothetical protein FHG87_018886 [Trinorchestia longiramus]